jgi:integrase
MQNTSPLTKSTIANARPSSKKYWMRDGKVPGLGVLVLPSGVKTWYLRYDTAAGRERQHKIGRADTLSPDVAREQAHKLLGAAAKGEDPTTARQQLRASPTLREFQELLERRHYYTLAKGTQANYEVIWRLHVLPVMGGMRVAEVTPAHIADLLAHKRQSGGTEFNVTKIRMMLSAAFNLAEMWGLRPQHTNPCRVVKVRQDKARRRYLKPAEIVRLGQALDQWANTPQRWLFACLVRLLLFTGARLREIMECRWEWVDLDAGLISIPPEHHKTGGRTGDDRLIHLPPEAVDILGQLRRFSDSPWIIPGQDPSKPFNGYRRLWLQVLEVAQIKNLRVHDLRHSFASYAISYGGLNLPAVGQLLGHTSAATTNRYAHLITEAAAAHAAKTTKLITSALAGGDGLVPVVPTRDRVAPLHLAGDQVEHHLANLHPRPQPDGMEAPGVLQLQGEPAAVPPWVAVPGQEVLQPLPRTGALEHELTGHMVGQAEGLQGLSQDELSRHQQERIVSGPVSNGVDLETLVLLLLHQQALPQGQVQGGRVQELLAERLNQAMLKAQAADLVIREDHSLR